MKNRYLPPSLKWLAIAAGLLIVLPPSLIAQQTGTVTGRVLNEATSAYLAGVRVEVEQTGQFVFTDRDGRYRAAVPAGSATLVFTYTGLDPARVTIDVSAGALIERNIGLTSAVYELDEFTVAGVREGSALATTLQRHAPNVKNVVASDTFGNLADGNIGDFLQRLPGVTAVYVGADVRQVQIRGIEPGLNSVTMDGIRVASSQSAGMGREFEMEQASLGLIETLEVTKAPTPDMDADSIGGNVNLVTKSAFDRAQPRFFTYSIGGVYRTSYRKASDDLVGPSMNFMYSDVIGPKENIGVMLTATYHSQPGGGATSLIDFGPTEDATYMWRVRVPRPSGAARTRLATGMKLDYKWSDSTIFSLNSVYNFFHENNDTRTWALSTRQQEATLDANGNIVGRGTIMPGYTEFFTEARPSATHPQETFADINIRIDDKSGRTYAFQPSGRHNFGATKIDYSVSYSNSKTYYEESAGGNGSRYFKSRPKGRVQMRLARIGLVFDRTRDPLWPDYHQTVGPDMYDLNNYDRLRLQHLDRWGLDEIIGGNFNFSRDLDMAVPAQIKTGVSYREQNRQTERNYRQYFYTGPDGIAGINPATGTSDDELMQFLDTSGQYDAQNMHYRAPPWPNPYAVARHHMDFPELYEEDVAYRIAQRLQADRSIREEVASAYLMGNARLGKVSVLGGLRMERTAASGEGPLQTITPEERARRLAWVGPVTPAEAARRAHEEWHRRDSTSGNYRKIFPGIHFRYEPFGGLIGRASWSTGIGRPSFGTLIPLNNVNWEAETVRVNNTGLRPQYSNNFDLSVEKYFEPVGMVSVGVFLKEIEDFIFTQSGINIPDGPDNGFDGQYGGFLLTTQLNGGFARVRGIEFNYQHQLSFLPGWMNGFGVYGNYTYLQTDGDYGGGEQRSTSEIAGFLPRAGNVGVSYNKYGFDGRIQMLWRGRHLTSYSTNASRLVFQQPHTRVDLRTSYRFNPKLSIFCDVENIFEEALTRTYWNVPERPNQTRLVSAKIVAGVRGRF